MSTKIDTLRQRMQSGQGAVGGWMSIDSAYAAELVGCTGFDAVVVDCQHGMAGHAQMVAMLQALSHTPEVPLVRVSGNNLPEINRALDAGAWGVICPLVNSAAEARAFGRACRYPLTGTEGDRSFGPARGLLVGGGHRAREGHGRGAWQVRRHLVRHRGDGQGHAGAGPAFRCARARRHLAESRDHAPAGHRAGRLNAR